MCSFLFLSSIVVPYLLNHWWIFSERKESCLKLQSSQWYSFILMISFPVLVQPWCELCLLWSQNKIYEGKSIQSNWQGFIRVSHYIVVFFSKRYNIWHPYVAKLSTVNCDYAPKMYWKYRKVGPQAWMNWMFHSLFVKMVHLAYQKCNIQVNQITDICKVF